jgi:hypothetical protein
MARIRRLDALGKKNINPANVQIDDDVPDGPVDGDNAGDDAFYLQLPDPAEGDLGEDALAALEADEDF